MKRTAEQTQHVTKTWKKDFELPVGMSLSAQRQVEVMTAKLGSTPERNLVFPCEQHIQSYDAEFFRGESIEATCDAVFHVLEQIVVGKDQIRSGIIHSVDVLEFEPGYHATLRLHFRGFVSSSVIEAIATYLVVPRSGTSCRLLVKVLVRYRGGWIGLLRPVMSRALTRHFRLNLLEAKHSAEALRS